MTSKACLHSDVREFDSLRSCLACGDTWFPTQGESSDDAEQYVYTDLRCLERGQTIRIVVIEPGEYSESLRCTLELSDLRHTNYHAVSYTWATEDGDETKTQQVLIDNKILSVTKNCEAALRRLRKHGPHSRFWIDAICINQSSTAERNHQVYLMDKIYQNAMRVHICIEDNRFDYTEAMRWLAHEKTGERRPPSQLETLFQCRYFSRVWVTQEVVLAAVLTLHVNNDHLELSRQVLSNMQVADTVPRLFQALMESTTQQSLEQLLKLTFAANCSEPKDRIYAVHSLLDAPAKKWIPIDYSLSMEEIFTNVVLAYIDTTRTLDILLLTRMDCSNLVMDLNNLSIEQFASHFHTPKNSRATDRDVLAPKTWRPHVHIECSDRITASADIEAIDHLSSPVQVSSDLIPLGQILPKLMVRAYHIDNVRGRSNFSLEFFLRRFHMSEFYKDYTTDDLWSPQVPWTLSCQFLPEGNTTDIKTLLEQFSRKGFNDYCLFGTNHGVGVCNATIWPRDRLYFLDGVNQPFVLRPLETSCSDVQQPRCGCCHTFRIVGHCWWESLPVPGTSSDTEPPRPKHKPSEQYETIEIY